VIEKATRSAASRQSTMAEPAASMRPGRAACVVSAALTVEAALTCALVFFARGVLQSDAPMSVGNMRGTAVAALVIALPLLLGAGSSCDDGNDR